MVLADQALFTLDKDERWQLAYDPQQWILHRRGSKPNAGWKPVAFVGGSKLTLYRILAEYGVEITEDAKFLFDSFPTQFLDWYAQERTG